MAEITVQDENKKIVGMGDEANDDMVQRKKAEAKQEYNQAAGVESSDDAGLYSMMAPVKPKANATAQGSTSSDDADLYSMMEKKPVQPKGEPTGEQNVKQGELQPQTAPQVTPQQAHEYNMQEQYKQVPSLKNLDEESDDVKSLHMAQAIFQGNYSQMEKAQQAAATKKKIADYTKAPEFTIGDSWKYTNTSKYIDYNNPLEKAAMRANAYGNMIDAGDKAAIDNNTDYNDLLRQSNELYSKYKNFDASKGSTPQFERDAQLLAEIHNRMVDLEYGLAPNTPKGLRQYAMYSAPIRKANKYFDYYDSFKKNGISLEHMNPFLELPEDVEAKRAADRKAGNDFPDNYYYHMALRNQDFADKVHAYGLVLAGQTGKSWREAKNWAAKHADRQDEAFKEERANEFAQSPWYAPVSGLLNSSVGKAVLTGAAAFDRHGVDTLIDTLDRANKYASGGQQAAQGIFAILPEFVMFAGTNAAGLATTKGVMALTELTPTAARITAAGFGFMYYDLANTFLTATSRGEPIIGAELVGNSAKGFLLGGGAGAVSRAVHSINPNAISRRANYGIRALSDVAEVGVFAGVDTLHQLAAGEDVNMKSILLNNGAVIFSMKIAHNLGKSFGIKRDISKDTIKRVRDMGYNTLADEMEVHNGRVFSSREPLGYSEQATKEMRQLYESAGKDGFTLANYAEAMKPMGISMTMPGVNSSELIPNADGTFDLVTYDVDNLEISRKNFNKKNKAEAAFAKTQKAIERNMEIANAEAFDVNRQINIESRAARKVADELNAKDNVPPFLPDGSPNPDYEGVTANDILNFYKRKQGDADLKPEQTDIINRMKGYIDQLSAESPDMEAVKSTICEQYGIDVEAFDKAWGAEPKKRTKAENEACAAFNRAMAQGYDLTLGIATGEARLQNDAKVKVINRVDTNEVDMPTNPDARVYYIGEDGSVQVTTAADIKTITYNADPNAADEVSTKNRDARYEALKKDVLSNAKQESTETLEESMRILSEQIKNGEDKDGTLSALYSITSEEVARRKQEEWGNMTHQEKVQKFAEQKFGDKTPEEQAELTAYYNEHPLEFDAALRYNETHKSEIDALLDKKGLSGAERVQERKKYESDDDAFAKDFKKEFKTEPTERPLGFEKDADVETLNENPTETARVEAAISGEQPAQEPAQQEETPAPVQPEAAAPEPQEQPKAESSPQQGEISKEEKINKVLEVLDGTDEDRKFYESEEGAEQLEKDYNEFVVGNKAPVQESAPTQPQAVAAKAMPMKEVNGKQKPDFDKATPTQTYEFLTGKYSKEVADGLVANELERAQERVEKAEQAVQDAKAKLAEVNEKKPEIKLTTDTMDEYDAEVEKIEAGKKAAQAELDKANKALEDAVRNQVKWEHVDRLSKGEVEKEPESQPKAEEPKAEAPAQPAEQKQGTAETETPTQETTPAVETEQPAVETPTAEQPKPKAKQENGIHKDDYKEWEDKVGKRTARRIHNVAKKLGLRVELYDGDTTEDGYVLDGIVHVNRNSGEMETFTIGHEMTHDLQGKAEDKGSDVYKTFKDAAVQYNKENWDKIYADKIERYRERMYQSALKQGASEEQARQFADAKAKEFKERYGDTLDSYVAKRMEEYKSHYDEYGKNNKWSDERIKAAQDAVTEDFILDEVAADTAGLLFRNPEIAKDMFRNIKDENALQHLWQKIKDFFETHIASARSKEEKEQLIALRDKFNQMYSEVVAENKESGPKFRVAEGEEKLGRDLENEKTMRKFAQGKNNILKIGRDEYTDDFRRVQAESERLSDEDIRQYHRGGEEGKRFSDEERRALGAVYEGLLSRGLRLSPTDWIDLVGKGNTFRFAQVNGDLFHDIFEINRKYVQNGELVDLHNDYSDTKCYISSDGLCGFAIEPNGNLVSVFSLNPDDRGGFLYSIRDFARAVGMTHGDAFNSKSQPLEKIYEKTLGLKVASDMDYGMAFDHDDIAKNHGNPDVVFMVASDAPVERKRFTADQYDEAEAHQLSQIPKDRPSTHYEQLAEEALKNSKQPKTPKFHIPEGPQGEEMRREQQESKNFKDWFGDWENNPESASKVVDEDSRPLVVWHGDRKKDKYEFGPNSFFSPSKEYASRYVGDNGETKSFYLDIKKPFDIRNPREREIFTEYRNGHEPAKTKSGAMDWAEYDYDDLQSYLEERYPNEYDGFVLDEGADGGYGEDVKSRGLSYVPFRPEQVKSATDNNGGFSRNNPDVRFHIPEGPQGEEMRREQQESKNFKDWFGDWENDPENASKVVDEDGRPLIMSHNTSNEFYTFDRERIGSGQGQAYLGAGFNFSRTGNVAYGNNEMKVYLDARNPLESDGHKLTRRDVENVLRQLDEGQSDTLAADFAGEYAPYGSAEYNRALRKAVQNLMDYDDLGIAGSISVVAGTARANDIIDAFKKLGYDSTIEKDNDGRIMNAVVFDPTQIKSATENNGDFSRSNPDVRFHVPEGDSTPTFYSNAEKAVENIKQNKATAEQWLAMIKKGGGLKAGEDKWMGLSQWLEDNKGKSLTKDEVQKFIADNGIEMVETHYKADLSKELAEAMIPFRKKFKAYKEEIEKETGSQNALELAEDAFQKMVEEYGDDFESGFTFDNVGELEPQMDFYEDDLAPAAKYYLNLGAGATEEPINATRLEYTTEGLKNNREIAFVVPDVEPYQETDNIHFGPENQGQAVMWVRFGEATDKDGNRVLVIDEIQSNRHQDAREKGYRQNEKKARELRERKAEAAEQSRNIVDGVKQRFLDGGGNRIEFVNNGWEKYATDAEIAEYRRLTQLVNRLTEEQTEVEPFYNKDEAGRIPSAPFEKNWHEVAMKRMLRLAAEEGFDKVAWTKGVQQAKRYSIANRVEDLYYKKNEDGTYNISVGTKDSRGHGIGRYDDYNLYKFPNQSEADLVNLFGKEVAQKIINGKGRKGYYHDGEDGWTTFKGKDLYVGGEGMKGFYDNMLPRFMDKYGKKWGVKTGEVELPYVEKAGRTMHSVDVTPEMKESVMQGQPLFRVAEGGDGRRDFAAERRELIRRRLRGENVDAELERLNQDRRAAEESAVQQFNEAEAQERVNRSVRRAEQEAQREENRAAAEEGRPPVEIPRADLPETGYETPQGAVQHAQAAQLRAVMNGEGSREMRDTAKKQITNSLKKLYKALQNMNYEGLESATAKKLLDLEDAHDRGDITDEEFKRQRDIYLSQVQPGVAVRTAADAQREYDHSVVSEVVNLAKTYADLGLLDNVSLGKVKQMFTAIKNASENKSPIALRRASERLLDIMLDVQDSNIKKEMRKLLSTPAAKVGANGVAQGKMDVHGQFAMGELNGYIDKGEQETATHISNLMSRLAVETDATEKQHLRAKIEGAQIALDYIRRVKAYESNIAEIDNAMQDDLRRYKAGEMTASEYRELKQACETEKRRHMIEKTRLMWDTVDDMRTLIARSKEGGRTFREQQNLHADEVRHDGYRDLQDIDSTTQTRQKGIKSKAASNYVSRYLSSSLATLETMLRDLGRKSINGEGNLFNRFAHSQVRCAENEWKEWMQDCEILDAKAKEIFGDRKHWWNKDGVRFFTSINNIIKGLPKMNVDYMDGGKMRPHELDQGQLMYIYMVNKMSDGIMKLRRMGITAEKVEEIKNFLDKGLVEMADWLQTDFLPKKQKEYNRTHERVFGAPLADIDNYFPLRIDKNTLPADVDIANLNTQTDLNSTTTSGVKVRTHNTAGLDILNSNAIDVVVKHIQEMGHWNNFVEWNRDANTLLSDPIFTSKVRNMVSIYGTGDELLKRLKNAFAMGSGAYQPKTDGAEEAAVNVARGVSAAKVAFRPFTAAKQLLSLPAFAPNVGVIEATKATATPKACWDWCMENIPLFEKRWKSRKAGDTRLADTELDWNWTRKETIRSIGRGGMKANAFIDAVTVAIGTKATYDTKYKRYRNMGFSEQQAHDKAQMDATIAFNQSQQSSEGLFTSTLQQNRTWGSVALSVFRNSSMGFERRFVEGLRTAKKVGIGAVSSKYRNESLAFMEDIMKRQGLTDTQAKRAAKRIYNRECWRTLVNLVTFGLGVEFMWNVGGQLPGLSYGLYNGFAHQDWDRAKDIAGDAFMHAAEGGWVEGLPGGNVVSDNIHGLIKALQSGDTFKARDFTLMPVVSDAESILNKLTNAPWDAATDFVNLAAQSVLGVNPQTFTDAAVAVLDSCNGDFGTACEAIICMERILQVPQSQIENIWIDELNMGINDARKLSPEDIARRYAYYKIKRQAPLMWRLYNDEQEAKLVEKYEKKFKEKVNKDIAESDNAAESYLNMYKADKTDKKRDSDLDKLIEVLREQKNMGLVCDMIAEQQEELRQAGGEKVSVKQQKLISSLCRLADELRNGKKEKETKNGDDFVSIIDMEEEAKVPLIFTPEQQISYTRINDYLSEKEVDGGVIKTFLKLGGERSIKNNRINWKNQEAKAYYDKHKKEIDEYFKVYRTKKANLTPLIKRITGSSVKDELEWKMINDILGNWDKEDFIPYEAQKDTEKDEEKEKK